MALGTYAPIAVLLLEDANGNPLNAGKLYTYLAGTDTPATTYSTTSLGTANANPVVADSAGRCTVVLVPGQSYKFVCKNASDVTQWTRDNIQGVPTSSQNQDITGVAGEDLTAGDVVYLTSGQWFKADADDPAKSTTPMIGMVPEAIASGSSGTIRQGGVVTGLSGLVVGTNYYVSATAGLLTATAPGNARFVGQATATSEINIAPNPAPSTTISSIDAILTMRSFLNVG